MSTLKSKVPALLGDIRARTATRGSGVAARCFSSSAVIQTDQQDVKISDRMTLQDRTILVTGGGRGIGFAICKSIAQIGGNVAVIDTLEQPVEEFNTLEERYGVQASYFHGDVTKQDSLEQAFGGAVQLAGEINGCVTAAEIVIDKPFFDHGWEECMRVLAVNVIGTFWTAKLVSQHMSDHGKGGSLVFIASVAAQGIKIPQQQISLYNMSKAGVKGLVGPLSVEMAVNNIRVNSISPGVIMSPMTEGLKTMYPELLKMFENAAPARRIRMPADLTPAVVYLLSDAASFTTGADLPITSGLHAGTSMEWLGQ